MKLAAMLVAVTSIASAAPSGVRVAATSLTLQRGPDKPMAVHVQSANATQPSTSHPCTLAIRVTPQDVPFQRFDMVLDVMGKGSARSFHAKTDHGIKLAAKRGGVTKFIQGEKSSVEVDATVVVDGVPWRLRGRITVVDVDCAWD